MLGLENLILDLDVDIETSERLQKQYGHQPGDCYYAPFELLYHNEIDEVVVGYVFNKSYNGFATRHCYGIKDGKIIDSTKYEDMDKYNYLIMYKLNKDKIDMFLGMGGIFNSTINMFYGYKKDKELATIELLDYNGYETLIDDTLAYVLYGYYEQEYNEKIQESIESLDEIYYCGINEMHIKPIQVLNIKSKEDIELMVQEFRGYEDEGASEEYESCLYDLVYNGPSKSYFITKISQAIMKESVIPVNFPEPSDIYNDDDKDNLKIQEAISILKDYKRSDYDLIDNELVDIALAYYESSVYKQIIKDKSVIGE